jgi:hypothetical protein
VPADALGSDGINGWHEAARFAAHASAAVRSALIERAYPVLANDRQDDKAVVTALVTIAVVASHDPPVNWPSRATQLYDALAGLARGEPRHGPPRDPHAMPMKEDSPQASAVQACVYLARRSGGERSEAGRRLLEAGCHSRAPDVQRIANALTSDLDDAS